jgi:hypothetical protein
VPLTGSELARFEDLVGTFEQGDLSRIVTKAPTNYSDKMEKEVKK